MAYKKIQFKRGTKTGMPVLRSGEPGFTQDEKSLYIGDGAANQRFLNETQVGTKIDEKIASVTQSITNNVAALNESIASNITTVNQAITDKAKINGEATNVNFIRNEIVKDGLIYNNVKVKEFITTNISSGCTFYSFSFIFYGANGYPIAPFTTYDIATLTGYAVQINDDNGTVNYRYSDGAKFKLENPKIKINRGEINKGYIYISGNQITFCLNGQINTYTNDIDIPLVERLHICGSFSRQNSSRFSGVVDLAIYSKPLTSKEIQYNFSVLNNSPAINRINDYAISTDTDHVLTRTGVTEEERYTELLKSTCKEFTSNGEAITVSNGIAKQKVLSGKLEGQTVKNEFYANPYGYANILQDGTIPLRGAVYSIAFNTNTSVCKVNSFEPNTVYTAIIEVTSTTLTNGEIHLIIGNSNYYATGATQNGLIKIKFTTTNSESGFFEIRKKSEEDRVDGKDLLLKLGIYKGDYTSNNTIKNVTFGLSSTQAIVYNNGLKYSFYKDATDKASGTVITLGGVGGVYDKLEIKEDGSAVLTQNTLPTVFDGSTDENWTKHTEAFTNTDWFYISIADKAIGITNVMANTFKTSAAWADEELIQGNGSNNRLFISVSASKLTTQDLIGFKAYLQANPVTVRYQLATPIITTIDKSLVPAILTQATNTFTFGDAVAPYKVTIQAPVDKITDLETRLAQLEAVITSASNLSLMGNYADDEYNESLNQL